MTVFCVLLKPVCDCAFALSVCFGGFYSPVCLAQVKSYEILQFTDWKLEYNSKDTHVCEVVLGFV